MELGGDETVTSEICESLEAPDGGDNLLNQSKAIISREGSLPGVGENMVAGLFTEMREDGSVAYYSEQETLHIKPQTYR